MLLHNCSSQCCFSDCWSSKHLKLDNLLARISGFGSAGNWSPTQSKRFLSSALSSSDGCRDLSTWYIALSFPKGTVLKPTALSAAIFPSPKSSGYSMVVGGQAGSRSPFQTSLNASSLFRVSDILSYQLTSIHESSNSTKPQNGKEVRLNAPDTFPDT